MIKMLNKYCFKQLISMVKIGPSLETVGPLFSEEGANWPYF